MYVDNTCSDTSVMASGFSFDLLAWLIRLHAMTHLACGHNWCTVYNTHYTGRCDAHISVYIIFSYMYTCTSCICKCRYCTQTCTGVVDTVSA